MNPSSVLSLLEDDEEPDCPLCAEPLDATDLQARLCTACPFQPCLFCYQRLLDQAASEGVASKCPNCRMEYDEDRIDQQRLDPQLCVETGKKKQGRRWGGESDGGGVLPISRPWRGGSAMPGLAWPCGPLPQVRIRTHQLAAGAGGRGGAVPGRGRPPIPPPRRASIGGAAPPPLFFPPTHARAPTMAARWPRPRRPWSGWGVRRATFLGAEEGFSRPPAP